MAAYFHFRCLNELLPSRKYKTCWICFWPLWASMGLHSLALLKRPKNMCIYIYILYTHMDIRQDITLHCITLHHIRSHESPHNTSRHVTSRQITSRHITSLIYIYMYINIYIYVHRYVYCNTIYIYTYLYIYLYIYYLYIYIYIIVYVSLDSYDHVVWSNFILSL